MDEEDVAIIKYIYENADEEDIMERAQNLIEKTYLDMNEHETEDKSTESKSQADKDDEQRFFKDLYDLPSVAQLQTDCLVIEQIEQILKMKTLEEELATTSAATQQLEKVIAEENAKLKMMRKRNVGGRKDAKIKYNMIQAELKIHKITSELKTQNMNSQLETQKTLSLLQKLRKSLLINPFLELAVASCSKTGNTSGEKDASSSEEKDASSSREKDASSSREKDASGSRENDLRSSGETSKSLNARNLKKKPKKSFSKSSVMKPDTNDLTPGVNDSISSGQTSKFVDARKPKNKPKKRSSKSSMMKPDTNDLTPKSE